MSSLSTCECHRGRGVLLCLALVISALPTVSAGCFAATEEREDSIPAEAILPSQTVTSAAAVADGKSVALRVNGETATVRQLRYELNHQLEERPSMSRRAACEHAVDALVDMMLWNSDRARFKGSVSDATLTAAAWSDATFVAEFPPDAATELAQTYGVIPTVDPVFLELGLELVAQEDMWRSGAETPSPDEIATALGHEDLGIPKETAEAKARADLLAPRQYTAEADYLKRFREQADVEVLVDCATF